MSLAFKLLITIRELTDFDQKYINLSFKYNFKKPVHGYGPKPKPQLKLVIFGLHLFSLCNNVSPKCIIAHETYHAAFKITAL